MSEDRVSSGQTQPSERPDRESGPGRARSRKRSAAGPLAKKQGRVEQAQRFHHNAGRWIRRYAP